MKAIHKLLTYIRYINWDAGNYHQIPLCSNLDQCLPLPDLKNVKVLWPNRYCSSYGKRALEPIKKELSRFVKVELYDVEEQEFDWYEKGGFPVPHEKLSSVGKPRNPKGPNDIRGVVFEIHCDNHVITCAYDFSDYTMISPDILSKVDVYFKKAVSPNDTIPEKVISTGFYARNPNLLAKARTRLFKNPPERKIDVYGRFGDWTDSQSFREIIVGKLKRSSLNFTGGFGILKYPAYLKELMKAKIALDAPGQAPISPRLLEAMALGVVVVTVKPACVFPEPIIDGVHYVAIKDDASNLVEICERLLGDNKQREKIAKEAMKFFDRNFSPESMTRRILREAIR